VPGAESNQGVVELYLPLPGVFVVRIWGRLNLEAARAFTTACEGAFESAPHLRAFMDCEQVSGYDSAARSHLTEWVIRHRTRVRGLWVLTGSKLVAMGITVADTALSIAGVGRIHLVKRPELIAAIERALRRTERR